MSNRTEKRRLEGVGIKALLAVLAAVLAVLSVNLKEAKAVSEDGYYSNLTFGFDPPSGHDISEVTSCTVTLTNNDTGQVRTQECSSGDDLRFDTTKTPGSVLLRPWSTSADPSESTTPIETGYHYTAEFSFNQSSFYAAPCSFYDDSGVNVQRTYSATIQYDEPVTVDAPVRVEWDDDDDAAGRRPSEVTVSAYASLVGEQDSEPTASITVSAADDWQATFTGLPQTRGGQELSYRFVESDRGTYSGYYIWYTYRSVYSISDLASPVVVTNEYRAFSPAIVKHWDDENDAAGARPDSITVSLKLGDEALGTKTLHKEDATITDSPDFPGDDEALWIWYGEDCFKELDLPVADENDEAIHYTIEEAPVTNYTNTGINQEWEKDRFYSITNRYEPSETTSVPIVKAWYDDGHQDSRPESIEVSILADGVAVQTVTLTTADLAEWATGEQVEGVYPEDYTSLWIKNITGLRKYREGHEGNSEQVIYYTVVETAVPEGYEVGYGTWKENMRLITNTYVETPVITSNLSIGKKWDDEGNEDKRPESITVSLGRGEDESWTVTLNKKDAEISDDGTYWLWTDAIADIPVTGELEDFSIAENEVPGYELTGTEWEISGHWCLRLTNAYVQAEPEPEPDPTPEVKEEKKVETPKQEEKKVEAPKQTEKKDLPPTGVDAYATLLVGIATVASGVGYTMVKQKR